eukprot:gnl/TRDRNA2_/TRDRNA2_46608_c0_seq2.p1 gnl/TRDRNA2_/TRDRNA2_46608_c0~~gnl/TRDRNA2_/TRDRNA2_46608_c0_seq2.p1  ORF type:complete len:153 (-),score=32.10 gnl/TRDRNA2_/TRDRNA2_46608_c0_seq2:30-488(-)
MSSVELEGPRPRMFKLAVASEVETFKASSLVKSSLDAKDGFVHLSDCNGARVVAKLFFKDATDLQIFEVDESKLQGPVNWIVGKMGDEPPDAARLDAAPTTVHYLLPNGCVHVYSAAGVSWHAVKRSADVPLGEDGETRSFPEWLDTADSNL